MLIERAAVRSLSSLAISIVFAACGVATDADVVEDVDALPLGILAESFRVGSVDDPDLGFELIGGAAVDGSGGLYVSDRIQRRIHVVDSSSARVRMIGGRGEGPGEFSAISSLGVADDTLWVTDQVLGRITYFDLSGNVLRTVRMTPQVLGTSMEGVTARMTPGTLRPDGFFASAVALAASPEASAGPEEEFHFPHLRLLADGSVVDTLALESRRFSQLRPAPLAVKGRNVLLPRLPAEDPLVVVGPSWVDLVTRRPSETAGIDSFSVVRLADDGDTVFAKELSYLPREFAEARINAILDESAGVRGYLATLAREGSDTTGARAEVTNAIRAVLDAPLYEPPVSEGLLGIDGSLWLRRPSDEPEAEWLVLSSQGEARGRVLVPSNATILLTGPDFLLASTEDELGIPWLIKYRVEGLLQ